MVDCLLLSGELLVFIYVWHELDAFILGGRKKSLTVSGAALTFSVKPFLFSHGKGLFCCPLSTASSGKIRDASERRLLRIVSN